MTIFRIYCLLLCSVIAAPCLGNDDDNWSWRDQFRVRLGVGVGELETPIIYHDDRELRWLPQLSWYGERLYFENGLLGYALREHKNWQWDVVAYLNDDGLLYHLNNELVVSAAVVPSPFPSYPYQIYVLEQPERDLSTMLGFRFSAQNDVINWSVQAGSDVSDVHHGWEIHLRFDRTLWRHNERWTLNADLGVSLKSGSLVDYYYTPQNGEIAPQEGGLWQDCNANRTHCELRQAGPYKAQAGWRLNAGVQLNIKLAEQWSIMLQGRRYWLSDEMTASPIVTRDHYGMWFAGLVYGIN